MATKPTWSDLAVLDAHIERMTEASRYRCGGYRRHSAANTPTPPTLPLPPSPPPAPLDPRAATVAFILNAARRARGEDDPDDKSRDTEPGSPPEPGSFVLDAMRKRKKG
jgi:hypothetical protein